MEIMHTMASEAIAQRPKRRYYSPELKSQVVAECHNTGASVAGVALAHGINANIVYRWLREQAVPLASAPHSGFIALDLGSPVLGRVIEVNEAISWPQPR